MSIRPALALLDLGAVLALGSAVSMLALAAPASAQDARERYRAVGTEPFWSLSISDGRITYTPMEGAPVSERRPAPRTTRDGRNYAGRRIFVRIAYTDCSDGMSGLRYPHAVTVRVNGRTLRGCGGLPVEEESVAAPRIDGEWAVERISMRNALRGPNGLPTIRFGNGRVSGYGSCNSFSGSYRVEGNRVIIGGVAMTRMACPPMLMTQEQTLARAFRTPLTFTSGPNGRATLTGPAGIHIELRRQTTQQPPRPGH